LFPGSRLSSYLPEPAIRPYLAVAAGLYVAAFLGGVYAPPSLRNGLADAFMAAAEPYTNQSGGVLFLLILANNLIATILILVLGVAFGIVPFFGVLSNGLVLGILWRHAAEIEGYGNAALEVFLHGVFEVPALLLTASYGLWIGMTAIRRARGRKVLPIEGQMKHALRKYVEIILPLLVLTAAIETVLVIKAVS